MPEVRVVDTNVVSYVFRNDSRAALCRPHFFGADLIVSFMSVAELDRMAAGRGWGPGRSELLATFLDDFSVYWADRALCRVWAAVVESAKASGKPILAADAWIAATAVLLNVPLVTHNRRDYLGVEGLTLISESAP